ncbi:LysR substrate-binding domain-containing protein [Agathobacter rectalis]|uniref:LysR substrate-binding domain-containing protein n=1 Tax=Agathobacter rectalis TaxID=39491 RepID=UPI0027D26E87|nr:LysR substrate-binding domain-containing protein [Agathobacter rectalis]MDB8008455.1 LysR substrate-binding domain-containing protein [Agathobacter rectalis]MDB8010887.1 LysR substrate-binding domain-containing protein [Agathobacter rectalis]
MTNTFFIFIISLRRVIITIPYVHCNRLRILALSEDAARAVSESLGDAGEIRLCLRSSAVLVSNVLKDFIHEHPHVSFSISSEPKGCDLLIDSVSSAYDIPDNAHLLMTEEICLAVSSSHPLAHTGHISVEQMMDEKFIDLADTPSYAGVFNSIFSKCKKTPQIAYSCNDYILQGKLISLGLGVSFVASVTWTSSSLPENISLLHIDDCPHFRIIYYQPLGSFCSENQRIFEHQLEEYFKKLNK